MTKDSPPPIGRESFIFFSPKKLLLLNIMPTFAPNNPKTHNNHATSTLFSIPCTCICKLQYQDPKHQCRYQPSDRHPHPIR